MGTGKCSDGRAGQMGMGMETMAYDQLSIYCSVVLVVGEGKTEFKPVVWGLR